mmetsp:Transcript_48971/g.158213  ORF Transcript_48971/g.158213 Transcript_48971/m.158213 type:complete len:206 (+) Transcript_48971:3674-4291(+)
MPGGRPMSRRLASASADRISHLWVRQPGTLFTDCTQVPRGPSHAWISTVPALALPPNIWSRTDGWMEAPAVQFANEVGDCLLPTFPQTPPKALQYVAKSAPSMEAEAAMLSKSALFQVTQAMKYLPASVRDSLLQESCFEMYLRPSWSSTSTKRGLGMALRRSATSIHCLKSWDVKITGYVECTSPMRSALLSLTVTSKLNSPVR